MLQGGNVSKIGESILDLFVKIENNQFFVQLYDKRNDFPYFISRMPYLRSIILFKIFYSTYTSEILRTARATFKKSQKS